MAFGAKAMLVARTDGLDTNGVGFNLGNANFPTDLAVTDANTSAPIATSASYTFVAGDVGHFLFIQSGTNSIPGIYPIASVAGGAATLNAAIGAGVLYDGNQLSKLNTVVGCATVASPTGLVFGVNYSLSASPKIAFTDIVIDGAVNTNWTSAGNPVGKNFVGNYVAIASGTGFTVQRVEVVSTSGTTATSDKSMGTLGSTGGVGKLGGAALSPAIATGIMVDGNDLFIKSGTYTITSSSANVAGGRLSLAINGAADNWTLIEGYNTLPKDFGTRPVITAGSVGSITILSSVGSRTVYQNFILDGNSQASVTGLVSSNVGLFNYVHVQNTTVIAFSTATGTHRYYNCTATGCSGTAAFQAASSANVTYIGCEAYNNTTHGFSTSTAAGYYIHCVSSGNTGASSDGFATTPGVQSLFVNCVAYGNGRNGFSVTSSHAIAINCLAEEHAAGYGFTCGSAAYDFWLINCGGYNNASGNINTTNILLPAIGFVTGSATFFTNAASGNFALNNSQVRATGSPGLLPRGTTNSYLDIGVAQHLDPVVPAVTNVKTGITFGDASALTGTLTLPSVGNVLSTASFGAGGTEFTGTYVVVAAANVKSAVTFGAASAQTGTLTSPSVGNVVSGVTYGSGGNEFTGTYVVTAASDVRSGVSFGVASTGTVTLPSEGNVAEGIQFGAGGTEFTGTLESGSSVGCITFFNLEIGTMFKVGRTAISDTNRTRIVTSQEEKCRYLLVKNLVENTGIIYIGGSDVSDSGGYPLSPGEAIQIPVEAIANAFALAAVDEEEVAWAFQ